MEMKGFLVLVGRLAVLVTFGTLLLFLFRLAASGTRETAISVLAALGYLACASAVGFLINKWGTLR
jgi:hypothetical protein